LAPLAAARAVDLHVFVDPGLPGVITGDETRLRQILNNLVGNSIKFSGGGGLSDGKRGCVRLRLETLGDTGDRWRIRVTDNGIGMSEAVQQRLFTPFSQ
jgi:signal transduction histidine kinase